MISTRLQLRNHKPVLDYIIRKRDDGLGLVRIINNAMKINLIGILEFTTPIFSGDLLKSRRYREVLFKNVARLYITHTARDRNSGKPYVWYAEYGRGPAVARRSPKKWMRYWQIPHQSDGNPFKIFAKRVGPAAPSLFIHNAVMEARISAQEVGNGSIGIWLAK